MSTSIKSSVDGTQAIIQVNGVDKLTVDSSGNVVIPGKLTQVAQSMVRVNTANGYGSTNTMIRRFTTVVTNQGSDITYADSATLGASFTINTNGVYAISYTAIPNAANNTYGISLSTTSPTLAISSITTAECLALGQAYALGSASSVSWTGYITAGSVVRAHDDSGAAYAPLVAKYHFTIQRVA